ncbi:MAG: hypothetical protein PHV18_09895 [Lachnospiraceae bacterium]|nr:hypothetical protein [Lachnospiraceae bacterium]
MKEVLSKRTLQKADSGNHNQNKFEDHAHDEIPDRMEQTVKEETNLRLPR